MLGLRKRTRTTSFFLIALCCVVGTQSAWADDNAKLLEALRYKTHAFQDAKASNNKGVTFLLAQGIYKMGRELYREDPAKLAPIVFSYADAAARYREPIALELYNEALSLFDAANGTGSRGHIAPLVGGTVEAIKRGDRQLAYHWYKIAEPLLEEFYSGGSFFEARMRMGLAHLYMTGGETERARRQLDQSVAMLEEFRSDGTIYEAASLAYERAELEYKIGDISTAQKAYQLSLHAYLESDPMERRLSTIYKRLTIINHQLGEFHSACQNIIDGANFRPWSVGDPAYDPLGRYSTFQRGSARAKITFQIAIGGDCRASSIDIVEANGISKDEAKSWLSEVYFYSPQLEKVEKTSTAIQLKDTWILFPVSAKQ